MIYLIDRRHRVRTGPYHNSPLLEEWRAVGRFEAASPEEARFRAFNATKCDDPENDLRIAGIVTRVE